MGKWKLRTDLCFRGIWGYFEITEKNFVRKWKYILAPGKITTWSPWHTLFHSCNETTTRTRRFVRVGGGKCSMG